MFWVNVIAASLAVAIGATMLLSVGNKTAFASAIERLRTAGTLSFVMKTRATTQMKTNLPEEIAADPAETRSVTVFVSEDGAVRHQSDGDAMTVVFDDGRGLMLDSERKEATFFELDEESKQMSHSEWLDALKSKSQKPSKNLGKKILKGVEVEGFVVKDEYFAEGSSDEITIWVDLKSNELVLVELVVSQSEDEFTVKVTMTLSDFKYNEPMEESLFSLKVPEGYKEVKEKTLDEMILDEELVTDEGLTFEEHFIRGLDTFSKNYSKGKFPDALDATSFSQDALSTDECLKCLVDFQMLFVQLEKEDYEYIGAGKSRDDDRSMVLWYRNNKGQLRAIYSDLTAGEISEGRNPQEI